jgi:hypothetical protein
MFWVAGQVTVAPFSPISLAEPFVEVDRTRPDRTMGRRNRDVLLGRVVFTSSETPSPDARPRLPNPAETPRPPTHQAPYVRGQVAVSVDLRRREDLVSGGEGQQALVEGPVTDAAEAQAVPRVIVLDSLHGTMWAASTTVCPSGVSTRIPQKPQRCW